MTAAPPRAWQRMLSGRRLDILDPSPFDIELDDIAHGLARVARWNGQTAGEHAFSVAQHALLVEAIAAGLEPGLGGADRLTILLHDAPEYVVGDLITPLKAALGEAFRPIEDRLSVAIHLRFGLPARASASLRRLLKRADRAAAFHEAIRLAGFSHADALAIFGEPGRLRPDAEALLAPWTSREAQRRFSDRVVALDGLRDPRPSSVVRSPPGHSPS